MNDKKLTELIHNILRKGNNVEIKQGKDGIKIYEVTKKIVYKTE